MPNNYHAKPVDELTFTDDGMFQAVMHDPEICAQLVERLLNVRVNHIDYPELEKEKKEYEGLLYNLYLEHKDKFDKLSLNEKNAYYDFVKRDVSSYYIGIILKDNLDDFVNKMKK